MERRLTPPGGAPDLLPAEYAYELERSVLDELGPGPYAFAVRARTAGGEGVTTATSASFEP